VPYRRHPSAPAPCCQNRASALLSEPRQCPAVRAAPARHSRACESRAMSRPWRPS
jgi:hypothetical protein